MKHEPLPDIGQDGAVNERGRAVRAALAFVLVAATAWLLSAPAVAAAVVGVIAGFFTWVSSAPMREQPALVPAPVVDLPDRTQEVIDAVDDALLIIERQRIVTANDAARRLFGAERVQGDFRLALRHPAAADLITSDRDTETPLEIAGIGEADRRWVMSVRHIAGGAKLVTLRDRTDSWVAERMRVDFVANASHELRTPLATIIGFIETLGEGGGAEDAAIRQRFLGIMMGEAKRMQQLVDDLISLSRIEADRFSTPQTPLSLGPVVEEVVGVIRSGLRDDGDRIELTIARVPDVRADRVQIAQLLHNLIGNSIKYGRTGTPIRVLLDSEQGKVRLRVADEGEGIPAEHLPRLTERFYRVDAGRSRSIGGTGLGLAIVKHIAERHRAVLDIASRVGKGTTVTVTFPAMSPDTLSS
ncbi:MULTISPECIES: ATP-binding protein [unclassified Sphingomonas]|uniref:ATP-binding protein n=1 Tax=unclassified Sphingomonas TaxID=196159 RepID=UPI0006F450BF|nr:MULTISPECIES: ATP-binding protein [unclassified Sphingomonas]KQX17545.1 ATPase [Sphingomonas sp. Root1294]KQY70471.1 ATPase [Sphingomonas sp. Root50]KRB92043.1 ATPase [Sphingomonas sp. Root720]